MVAGKIKPMFANAKPVYLLALMALGLILIIIYGLTGQSFGWSAIAVGTLSAGSAALVGGLLGFLFGIPRTLQAGPPLKGASASEPDVPDQSPDRASVHSASSANYVPNTNLEQISDWLTKILVGVGLTQVHAIYGKTAEVAGFLGLTLSNGSNETGRVFGWSIIIFYSVSGFLLGYLWTRLYLPGALHEADLASRALEQAEKAVQQAEQAQIGVREVKARQLADAQALAAVQSQLDPSPGDSTVPPGDLFRLLDEASSAMRTHIYGLANMSRKETWKTDKRRMELTIPVFEALVATDKENRSHLYRAQLAFALKDKQSPSPDDLRKAEEYLNQAIKIRGDAAFAGLAFYEFNRAICSIRLDDDYRAGRKTPAQKRERILADLAVAKNDSYFRKVAESDPEIQSWTKLNSSTAE